MKTRVTKLIVGIVLAVAGMMSVSSCSAEFNDGFRQGYKATTGIDL